MIPRTSRLVPATGEERATSSELVVVRHAESVHNATGRTQGWVDSPLSARGQLQAEHGGTLLRAQLATGTRIDAVVASDLSRAVETARLLARGLGVEAAGVELEPGLREYQIGEWSGLSPEEIEARWPGQLALWHGRMLSAPPGGEDRAAFSYRVRRAFRSVAERHAGQRVLVVTHGGVLRMVERRAGLPGRPLPNLTGRQFRADIVTGTIELGPAFELAPSGDEPADQVNVG